MNDLTSAAEPAVAHVAAAFRDATVSSDPFRHYTLQDVLTPDLLFGLRDLPVPIAPLQYASGQRAANNSARIFCTPDARRRFPVWNELARIFQHDETLMAIEDRCAISLGGTYLRIEYCLDRDGFWLEPHTDIGAKRLTMLIYLSDQPGSEAWGTDLLYPDGSLYRRAEARCNAALVFVPAANTWHGFAPRPIAGVRRSLIVNYVGPEWMARQELAYPGEAV